MAELSTQTDASALADTDELPALVGGNFRAVPLSRVVYSPSVGGAYRVGPGLTIASVAATSATFKSQTYSFQNDAGGTLFEIRADAAETGLPLTVGGLLSAIQGTSFGTSSNTNTHAFGGGVTITRTGSGSVASISLTGSSRNWISFNGNGSAAPAFTSRSAGVKIMFGDALGASSADYAIGRETSAAWFGVPTTAELFKWYGGTTLAGTLTGLGVLTVAGSVNGVGATFTDAVTITGASGTFILNDRDGSGQWLLYHYGGALNYLNGSTTHSMTVDGIIADGSLRPKSYTVATVPSASAHGAGAEIHVSNETGGATNAFSDGSTWRRYSDRATIA